MEPPRHAQHRPARRFARIRRDVVLIAFGMTGGTLESIFGGGRASVLGFFGSFLISPLVIRYDEAKESDRR